MKRLHILLLFLLLAFAGSANAYDMSSGVDCSHITSEKELAACPEVGNSGNFLFKPMLEMFGGGAVCSMSNTGLNVLLGHSDTDRISCDVQEPTSSTGKLVRHVPAVISTLFMIVMMFNFNHILAQLARTGKVQGGNHGFYIFNLIFVLIGQGFNGKFYLTCAAMFVGMYLATATALNITPVFINASVNDESATYSRGMRRVATLTPALYASMVKAHMNDMTTRNALYTHYATKTDDSGKVIQTDTIVIADAQKRERVYNNFAACLSQSAGLPYFEGQLLKDGEFAKSARCAKESGTGIKNFQPASFYYMGDNEHAKQALITADLAARKTAEMLIQNVCSTSLNRNDNRARFQKEALVYQQCVDLNADGVPRIIDGEVQLIDSTVSSADIVQKITKDVEELTNSFKPLLEDLQIKAKIEADSTSGYSADITSLLYLITRAHSRVNITKQVQAEFEKMHFSQNGSMSLNPMAAASIGISTEDLQDTVDAMGKKVTGDNGVQKLVNFDAAYANQISQKLNANISVKLATNIIANFMSFDFFEATGFTSDDCLSGNKNCVVAALNQGAAQHAAGIQAIEDLTYVFTGLKFIALNYDIQRKIAMSNDKYPVVREADVALRRIEWAVSVVKNAITFFIGTMIIKDNIFVFIVVGQLMAWLYDFFPTNIVMTRESLRGIKTSSKDGSEVKKANSNVESTKKIFWMATAPSLYVAMYFINQGLYSYALTIEGSNLAVASKLISFGGMSVVNELVSQISLFMVHVAFATAMPIAIIMQTNKVPKKIERMFNMQDTKDGDRKAIEASQQLDSKINNTIHRI